jgi:hypothetical protein
MHSISEKVFKDLMVKELKSVKQNIFDFVNTISTDMKLSLEQNHTKLSSALATISGLAETVIEVQISTNNFGEKLRAQEQNFSENFEGKLPSKDCKKIYERIDLVTGELEGKIYEIVGQELEKEKDFYGNTRKSSGDIREDIGEEVR